MDMISSQHLNLKAIIPNEYETALAVAWHHERRDEMTKIKIARQARPKRNTPCPDIAARTMIALKAANRPISSLEAASLVGATRDTVARHLKRFVIEGIVIKTGRSTATRYHLSTGKPKPITPKKMEPKREMDQMSGARRGLAEKAQRTQDSIAAFLDAKGSASSSEIAAAINMTPQGARDAMRRMRAEGIIIKTGPNHKARYELVRLNQATE